MCLFFELTLYKIINCQRMCTQIFISDVTCYLAWGGGEGKEGKETCLGLNNFRSDKMIFLSIQWKLRGYIVKCSHCDPFCIVCKPRIEHNGNLLLWKHFRKGDTINYIRISRPDIKRICVNSNRLLYNDESINTDNYTSTTERDEIFTM